MREEAALVGGSRDLAGGAARSRSGAGMELQWRWLCARVCVWRRSRSTRERGGARAARGDEDRAMSVRKEIDRERSRGGRSGRALRVCGGHGNERMDRLELGLGGARWALGRLGRPRWKGNGQRPGWAYLSLLSLIFSLTEKQKERGKEKEG